MRALQFWKAVTMDGSHFLERVLAVLDAVDFCVIGGTAVNAYSPPVVTLDLDVAIAAGDLPRLEKSLAEQFEVPGSDLRLQLQTDPRYEPFVARARVREVMGLRLPVAAPEDVLQGKIWAVQDAERRPSKRQKDLADIARLLEAQPALRERVPAEVLALLIK